MPSHVEQLKNFFKDKGGTPKTTHFVKSIASRISRQIVQRQDTGEYFMYEYEEVYGGNDDYFYCYPITPEDIKTKYASEIWSTCK